MSTCTRSLFAILNNILTHASSAIAADFNKDGKIDFADFVLFAQAYGSAEGFYDLDGNGVVDFADFFKFVDAFRS